MPVINGKTLLAKAPIREMVPRKMKAHGTSYGLTEAGYDIRIKQSITFFGQKTLFDYKGPAMDVPSDVEGLRTMKLGRFTLASAIEEFDMPADLVGVVHDKSTWARQGLSVFNTVIEPGWKGFLTLELVFHGSEDVVIPAGSGIAQVIYMFLCVKMVPAILAMCINWWPKHLFMGKPPNWMFVIMMAIKKTMYLATYDGTRANRI